MKSGEEEQWKKYLQKRKRKGTKKTIGKAATSTDTAARGAGGRLQSDTWDTPVDC